jgi:serine/threonine-protein kinase
VREGSSIGAYRVLRKIGQGGMGTVFLAEHALLGRFAAIKILLPELSSKRAAVDRFFNEARATTAISDPGIVQLFDFGFTADNIAYIVMELLEGEQLHKRLKRLGALPPADALRITRQVAGSLGAAHAAGIVHRDLKPENLFMIRDSEAPGGERAKILDFGIAKLDDDVPDRVRTRTGAVMGTPLYMSPEQCNGACQIDHRADIYSLGCVLFHLLTGRPPFDLHGVGAIISAHLREPAPLPSSVVGPLPPGLDELVLRCLAKSPADRFATTLELQQACDAILTQITGAGPAMPASMSAAVPRVSRPSYESLHTPPAHDALRTTLGDAAGQPPATVARRRIGRWIVVAVLAGGTGGALAVLTARSGLHKTSAVLPALTEAAARDAPPAAAPPDAAVVPIAVLPAFPSDAGTDDGAAAPPDQAAAGSPGRTPPAVILRKPTPIRKAGKLPPTKPTAEDLYDDRN